MGESFILRNHHRENPIGIFQFLLLQETQQLSCVAQTWEKVSCFPRGDNSTSPDCRASHSTSITSCTRRVLLAPPAIFSPIWRYRSRSLARLFLNLSIQRCRVGYEARRQSYCSVTRVSWIFPTPPVTQADSQKFITGYC